MGLTLSKVSEDATSITLGWIPVPGAAGYRFTAEKQLKPSHTWNPSRNRVTFAKGSAWYKVEALSVAEEGVYPPVGRQYPASYRQGPLGDRVPLPDKPGAFMGVYGPSKPDGTSTWAEVKANISAREQAMGRRYDFIMAVDDQGEWAEQRMAWIDNHGAIAVNAGLNFGEVGAVASGAQDARIDAFADHYRSMPFTVMVRLMHEFNQQHVSYTSLGKEQAWIAAWKRIVGRFPPNVGFWFCPLEGGDRAQRNSAEACFNALIPTYIDWTGSDQYNHCFVNENTCYSTPRTPGWVSLGKLFNYGLADGSRYAMWSPHKPFVIGETGTVYDPNAAAWKGEWFRAVPADVRAMPELVGLSWFDVNATPWEAPRNNWLVDYPTSNASVMAGYVAMSKDPILNTRD